MAISDYVESSEGGSNRRRNKINEKAGAAAARMIVITIVSLLFLIVPAEAKQKAGPNHLETGRVTGQPRAPEESDLKLLHLAQDRFNKNEATKLTVEDEDFFRFVANGNPKLYSHRSGKTDDFENAANWPAVKADWIVWLCTDPEALKLVTYHGINIQGARIVGEIDLEGARVPFRLLIRECAFMGDVKLRGAHLEELNLSGSSIKGLRAEGARIEGFVFLDEGFRSKGMVSFYGATIDGDLNCRGSHLSKSEDPVKKADDKALDASEAKIVGTVFLSNLGKISGKEGKFFEANGEVNLIGATIGGDLDCKGGHFGNPDGFALVADAAKIIGSVFLGSDLDNDGKMFEAEGEVSFISATIDGSLSCVGGHLIKPSGDALDATSAKIGGNVILSDRFKAVGKIDFKGADVAGYMVWRKVESPEETILNLESAKIGTLRDEKTSWPKPCNLHLDGFVYNRIDNLSPTAAKSRLDWLKLMPDKQFFPQPYEQLATVLKNMGHDEQAAEVLIRMNREHGRYVHTKLGEAENGKSKPVFMRWSSRLMATDWWWYKIIGPLIGYGYRPGRALYISLGFISLGYALFKIGHTRGLMWPENENAVQKMMTGEPVTVSGRVVVPKDYTRFNAFVYSLEAFTPLVQLGQNARWSPNANRGKERRVLWARVTTGGLLRGYLWFHIIVGWVLTTLWVGAITGLVKS